MKNPLVSRFAAHIAHLLWGEGTPVDVNAWALRIGLIRTLERTRQGYLTEMVGVRLMGLSRDDPDDAYQAADTWFTAVMERALELHGSRPTQKAHEVFAQVCARGAGWPATALERRAEPPGGAAAEAVKGAFGRLEGALDRTRAPSRITAAQGPLWLVAGDAAQEVPEGMSVWQSIALGPQKLDPGAAEARDAFFHAMIQAVETANEAWEVLRRLGLSPRDWAGAVSINQAKSAGTFVNEARRIAEGRGADLADRAVLEAAWQTRQVSRFDGLDAFLGSAFGRAVIEGPGAMRTVDIDTVPEIADPREPMAGLDETTAMVDSLAERGILQPLDRRVLLALAAGDGWDEIADTDWGAAAFPNRTVWAEYTDKLHETVLAATSGPGE